MKLSALPVALAWEDLHIGRQAQLPFTVSQRDMDAYAELSGDASTVHHDAEFAKRSGFRAPIVYGGLMIAALSRMVGIILPGPIGVAVGWRIDFHSPLYIEEAAILSAEVAHVSESTRLVKLRFAINVNERLIAKGTAEAKIVV